MMTMHEDFKEEISYDEEKLQELLEGRNIREFREEYFMLHPYDRAKFYEKQGGNDYGY